MVCAKIKRIISLMKQWNSEFGEPVADRSCQDFKKCLVCGFIWPSLTDFLDDPGIVMIGYQASFNNLDSGLFLFNHTCRTTLGCEVELFRSLYQCPVYCECQTGRDECPGYCLNIRELAPCPVKCSCAYVREIIQLISQWPKRQSFGSDRQHL